MVVDTSSTLLIAAVLGAALIAAVYTYQTRQYAAHVKQLNPTKEKRSKPLPAFQVYTREEVAKHNKSDDAWIIVQDKATKELRVYDVTEYVDEHPGGDAILYHAGGEATEGFFGPQHTFTVYDTLQMFLIGKVPA